MKTALAKRWKVAAPAAAVWETMTDCRMVPEWMSSVERCQAAKRSDTVQLTALERIVADERFLDEVERIVLSDAFDRRDL